MTYTYYTYYYYICTRRRRKCALDLLTQSKSEIGREEKEEMMKMMKNSKKSRTSRSRRIPDWSAPCGDDIHRQTLFFLWWHPTLISNSHTSNRRSHLRVGSLQVATDHYLMRCKVFSRTVWLNTTRDKSCVFCFCVIAHVVDAFDVHKSESGINESVNQVNKTINCFLFY